VAKFIVEVSERNNKAAIANELKVFVRLLLAPLVHIGLLIPFLINGNLD